MSLYVSVDIKLPYSNDRCTGELNSSAFCFFGHLKLCNHCSLFFAVITDVFSLFFCAVDLETSGFPRQRPILLAVFFWKNSENSEPGATGWPALLASIRIEAPPAGC